ncbi:hypothetical protein C8J56DRAFT_477053 [Mycena floridula]|nr:hypothetical protein C8J56DRAFT_477053 [Mycena floridula]
MSTRINIAAVHRDSKPACRSCRITKPEKYLSVISGISPQMSSALLTAVSATSNMEIILAGLYGLACSCESSPGICLGRVLSDWTSVSTWGDRLLTEIIEPDCPKATDLGLHFQTDLTRALARVIAQIILALPRRHSELRRCPGLFDMAFRLWKFTYVRQFKIIRLLDIVDAMDMDAFTELAETFERFPELFSVVLEEKVDEPKLRLIRHLAVAIPEMRESLALPQCLEKVMQIMKSRKQQSQKTLYDTAAYILCCIADHPLAVVHFLHAGLVPALFRTLKNVELVEPDVLDCYLQVIRVIHQYVIYPEILRPVKYAVDHFQLPEELQPQLVSLWKAWIDLTKRTKELVAIREDYLNAFCSNPECPSQGTRRAVHRCGSCHYFLYCGRECQQLHWHGEHQKECAQMSTWSNPDVSVYSKYSPARRLSTSAKHRNIVRVIAESDSQDFFDRLRVSKAPERDITLDYTGHVPRFLVDARQEHPEDLGGPLYLAKVLLPSGLDTKVIQITFRLPHDFSLYV